MSCPYFKRRQNTEKTTGQLVLPTISKIYESIMHIQVTDFINLKLSQLLCGFCKNYNTQHALICLIEKWRNALDEGNKMEAVMMDLSKASDCIY